MEQIYSSVYRFVKPENLRPEGWLKRQLEIQAEGLSGHLDEIWPDIRDSAWIGGKAEGWERVPYWLDGFVPLAYLLRDEALIARAKKYVEAIMDAQQEDGWLCPCTKEERAAYDVWAVFIICKALMIYGQCSGDNRAAETVYRAMKNLEGHLTHCTLFNWGQSRWFEALIPLQWLYEQRPEPWMIELAVTIASQGLSYERVFACWKDQQPDPRGVWRQQTHIVNLMMALKSEALFSGPFRAGARRVRPKNVRAAAKVPRNAHGTHSGRRMSGGEKPHPRHRALRCGGGNVFLRAAGLHHRRALLARSAGTAGVQLSARHDLGGHVVTPVRSAAESGLLLHSAGNAHIWHQRQSVQSFWVGTELWLLYREFFAGLAQAGTVRLHGNRKGTPVGSAGSFLCSAGTRRRKGAGHAGNGISLPRQSAVYRPLANVPSVSNWPFASRPLPKAPKRTGRPFSQGRFGGWNGSGRTATAWK